MALDLRVVFWDLRVVSAAQGRGVASARVRAVEEWAVERGCSELKVETQNTNPAACRLYGRMGCELSEVNFHAYQQLPGEIQLIWRKAI